MPPTGLMHQTHKSLSRQIADEQARHPTPREAAVAGVKFSLPIVATASGLLVFDKLFPGQLASSFDWPSVIGPRFVMGLIGAILSCVFTTVLLFELGAIVIRWRRRMSAKIWHSKPVD